MTDISQNGYCRSPENQGLEFHVLTKEVESCTTREANAYVNHGETAWNEMRKHWVGNTHHRRRHIVPEDPIISWSTTYEELLWTGNVFDKAIPLSEMVDFLVDIWNDEGLYD